MGRRNVALLVLVLVLAVACAASPSPPGVSTACQSDAECELVSATPPGCCSRCEPTALSRGAAEAARKQCRALESASGDYFSRCPHLDCACTRTAPRCKAHVCVVESTPC